MPADWSSDIKYLLLEALGQQSGSADLWLYDFNAKSVKPWLQTKFDEVDARFSPGADWVAYASNATGRFEIYLCSFKRDAAPIPISSSGGRHPAWRRDGRELFYLSPTDELMAVSVEKLGSVPEVEDARHLFKIMTNDIASDFSPYDVTPDGQRFLVNVPEPPEPLLFIQGFEELLKRGQ
jgi:Tol biopolymer transport system component